MVKINNYKLEKQIKEILQNSRFASVEEYLLLARMTMDLKNARRSSLKL